MDERNELPANAPLGEVTFQNNGGFMIGQNNAPININLPQEALGLFEKMYPAMALRQSHAMEWAALSRKYYNLFVLENETYAEGSFSISKTAALQKYTDPELLKKFQGLSPEHIIELQNMPCVFAMRNPEFKSCHPDFPACIGRITKIAVQANTIKFWFNSFRPVCQILLNQNADNFSLLHSPMRNELDEEHWAIKSCNLIKTLEDLGVVIQ